MIRALSLLLAALLVAACAAPASPAREHAAQTSASTPPSLAASIAPSARAPTSLAPSATAPAASIAPSATAPPSPAPTDTADVNNSDPLEAGSPPNPPWSGPPPFELRLRVTTEPDPMLEVTLRNKSSRPQRFLHDSYLQPSQLELISPRGRAIEAFDGRAAMKFDTSVHAWMFQELGPGKEAAVYYTKIVPAEGGHEVYWGPYELRNLAPGTYLARVVWRSEVDTYLDDANDSRRLRGVWKGTVTSNWVKFRIP
jgi:hypothetical protein